LEVNYVRTATDWERLISAMDYSFSHIRRKSLNKISIISNSG
jgi:hypothetical protein